MSEPLELFHPLVARWYRERLGTATDEQRRVSGEVAQNIEAIATMSRDNSRAVEQTAASACEMETLAKKLQSTVGRFRT
jgi:methyl-accepting chemotaxis protein